MEIDVKGRELTKQALTKARRKMLILTSDISIGLRKDLIEEDLKNIINDLKNCPLPQDG